jgi:hypothetical protein
VDDSPSGEPPAAAAFPAPVDLTAQLLGPEPPKSEPAATPADPVPAFIARLLKARALAFKRQGLGAILRSHAVSAPSAGTLTEQLYLGRPRIPGASASGATPLIASGTRMFARPGASKLPLRTTAAARKARKASKRLTLTLVVSFTRARSASPVAASVTVTRRLR